MIHRSFKKRRFYCFSKRYVRSSNSEDFILLSFFFFFPLFPNFFYLLSCSQFVFPLFFCFVIDIGAAVCLIIIIINLYHSFYFSNCHCQNHRFHNNRLPDESKEGRDVLNEMPTEAERQSVVEVLPKGLGRCVCLCLLCVCVFLYCVCVCLHFFIMCVCLSLSCVCVCVCVFLYHVCVCVCISLLCVCVCLCLLCVCVFLYHVCVCMHFFIMCVCVFLYCFCVCLHFFIMCMCVCRFLYCVCVSVCVCKRSIYELINYVFLLLNTLLL